MIPSNCDAGEDSESPLDSKEIKPVNLKGDQPWIFTERTDAEVETPVFWSSDADSWLTGRVPVAGQVWGQKLRASVDEIVGCHHRELGQTSGDGEGQRGLMCYSPLGSQRVGHSWATEQQQQQVNNDKLYIHTHVHIQTHTHTTSKW